MKLNNETLICGIDEAGRGPLAGQVFAAAVILPLGFDVSLLADSKKLNEKKRQIASKYIFENALWGIGAASVKEIDDLNILQASLLAMKRSYESLLRKANLSTESLNLLSCIVDGNKVPDIKACKAIVKADTTIPEVMAASIIAKVSRDKVMNLHALKFPQYGYEKHKGYCTKMHLSKIYEFGPSPIQRKSFAYPKPTK